MHINPNIEKPILIQEASKLHMKKEEIISLIERGFEHEQNSD